MPWEQRTSLPIQTYGHNGAAVAGKIYHAGGYNNNTSCYEYDPTLNTWTVKASANATIQDHQAAVRSGVIHYIYDGTGSTSDSNEIRTYTPSTNLWNSITDSTVATIAGRYGWLVTGANNNIYQGGGSSNTGVHRWNGSAWSNVTTISPATAYEHSKAVLGHDGNIYIHGGTTPLSVYTGQMLRYTPDTTWATRTAAPITRWGHTMAAANPWIYILGGYSDTGGYTRSVLRYDPVLDTYTVMDQVPHTSTFKMASAVVDTYLYIWGGYNGSAATGEMWRTEVGYDEMSATLSASATLIPYPSGLAQLVPDSSLSASLDVGFSRTVEADSFVDMGATGSESFDALFPSEDLYPSDSLYPGGDF